MNVSSKLVHARILTVLPGVVLSAAPVWSRPSDFPASDMKLSLTLQMVLFGFNERLLSFFFFLPLLFAFLLPTRCDPCMNAASGGDLCDLTRSLYSNITFKEG